ncbi:tape measure protein [Kiloniella litopenaei]|uniref:tape measure protein n=1 Tax=Kiloniella litopenaei TaxID=1549748 RepID=UPI000697E241|nr:tape measure protein [Kiloniella litopenaei]
MSEIERLIWQIEAKTEGLRRELKRAEQSGEKFTRKMDQTVARTNSQFAGLGRVLSGAVVPALGAVAGALSVQQIYRYAEAWKQTENRLKLVTNGTAELTATQNSLFSVAQNTRSSFESTADLYSRVARSTEELNLSQSKLIELTTIVNQASRISGGGVQEAAAAVQQFGQALQSDRLQGDELRSILENAPRLAKALADGLGVSVGELRALGAEGSLTADKIVNALSTQSQALQEEFDKIEKTGAEALTQLDNAFLRLISTMDRATGFSKGFAKAVSGFSDFIEDAGLEDAEQSISSLSSEIADLKKEISISEKISFFGGDVEEKRRELQKLQDIVSSLRGDLNKSPLQIQLEFDLDSLQRKAAEAKIRATEELEKHKSNLLDLGFNDVDGNDAVNQINKQVVSLNKQIIETINNLSKLTGGQHPGGAVAITSTATKEKPPTEEELKEAEAIKRKREQLQFLLEQEQRNERQQFLNNQLNQLGIDINHKSAGSILKVANALFDVRKKKEELAKADQDKKEADAELEQQTKAVKDVEQEIANIEREVQALLQGKEAYEAYQQAREIEQGSEAIRERLEALGLEEEQINRLIEAYERHSEELDKAEETFKKREEAVERQKQSEQELADILENGIGRSLSAAADGWDALGKVALDVLGQILAESLKLEDVLSSSGGSGGGSGIFGGLFSSLTSGIGSLFKFADGGKIVGPGGPRSDSILAAVSNGEYVVNAAATAKNLPLLEAINSGNIPAFADGGFVGGSVPRVPDISKSMQTINNSNRSSSNNSVVYNIDARGAEVGVEQKIKQALDEREPLIIEGAVQQVQEESYRSGSGYLGGY